VVVEALAVQVALSDMLALAVTEQVLAETVVLA
jgi:hypothetical protein